MTVLLITGISFVVVPRVIDLDPTISNDWNFTSPLTLANAMENHLNNLIYLQVSVGEISSSINNDEIVFGFNYIPFFSGNVQNFRIFNNLEGVTIDELVNFPDTRLASNSKILVRDVCCTIEKRDTLEDPTSLLKNIQKSLEKDFQMLDNYNNITNNSLERINDLEMQNGEFYWEIQHLYNDGRLVLIRAFGTDVIIQDLYVTGIIKLDNGYIIFVDNSSQTRITYESTFTSVPFETYRTAINDLLLIVGT